MNSYTLNILICKIYAEEDFYDDQDSQMSLRRNASPSDEMKVLLYKAVPPPVRNVDKVRPGTHGHRPRAPESEARGEETTQIRVKTYRTGAVSGLRNPEQTH